MPRTIIEEKTVFTYAELDDSAKENARNWYASCIEVDDYQSVIEDFETIAEMLGVEFNTRRGSSQKCIWWSGFCSQGDGACFEGRYDYKKGAAKTVREYAPQDSELHRIAADLQTMQRRYFYRLSASITHSGHYYHAGCTRIEVVNSEDRWQDLPGEIEDGIAELMRDLMHWLYKALDRQHDWLTSEENVAEMCEANAYEFDENGRIN